MHPVLFSIGPLTAYSYGCMIAVGVLYAFWLSSRRAAGYGLDRDELYNLGLAGLAGGLVGAKLLYIIVELPAILKDPSILLNITDGFVVYGGILLGFAVPFFVCRKKGLPFLRYLDIAVAGVAGAQGFGRIGCFLAGCCYGKHTDAWFGVRFPENSLAPAAIPLIPTQLISSAGDFLLSGILILLYRRKHADGEVSAWYLILYAIGRFLTELLRGDPRGKIGILSTSQAISVVMFAAGCILLAARRSAGKRTGSEAGERHRGQTFR